MLKEFGHYRLLRPLAQSRCEVYAAEDTTSKQQVAIKILPHWDASEDLRDRLRQDMTAATQLNAPHLVPVDDWGEIDGRFFLQMPLLSGVDLQTRLDRDGPLELSAAADLVHQLAEALDAAHRAGLIHSGVAPQNIFVADDGSALLLGLGYRDYLAECESSADVLDSETRLGCVGWPPERFTHGERSERADVYGLASVAYACLTGALPHQGGTAAETPGPPSRLRPNLPTGIDDAISRGMCIDPADRFARPQHLANALRDALGSGAAGELPQQFGPYRLLRQLPGSRFACYEAENTATAARVAVKMFAGRGDSDPLVRRVKREASMAALVLRPLGEPQLVVVDHVDDVDGQFYVQMPFIDGIDLETLLDRYGPLSPSHAVQIVSQIAGVLDAVHHAAPIPGAVIPDKILVGHDNLAYLLCEPVLHDKLPDDEPDSGPIDVDPPGFGYFAPERLKTGDRTNAGDRYSLACILYACLTGTPPFSGSAATQMQGHLDGEPPEPSALVPWVPSTFDAVIARGMAKDPQERYPSAGELAAAARAALASVAAPTLEESNPLHTLEASTVRQPIKLPVCKVCGQTAVLDPRQTAELLCGSCRRQGLPSELLRRVRRDTDEPVTIAGYVLLETLERPGPGPVFRVRSQQTGEICALRVAPKSAIAPDERRRPRPMEDLSGLHNPHLVELQEATSVGEFVLLVSEYCPGDTVEVLIRRLGRLSVRQAMSLVLPCLDGLDAAHSFARSDGSIGVMHRNITPASLLLTWSGSQPATKIADFGFATAMPPDPAFTPLHQLVKPERAARDVDTWRMGACLYYMLTGETPRRASAGQDPTDVVMSTTPAPIRRKNPEIPPRLAAVIDDAVTDTPHVIIPTASHLAAALREAVRFG